MSIYAHIKRCLELSDRDIVSAVADRRLAKALLDQLAKVSRPGDGAPKLLLVFARLAGSSVEWIDGALRVEMVGDADVTVVEVLSELGLGMHERVFPSFKMGVPLEEFARAVERVPHMVAPLKIAAATSRRLVLTAISEEEDEEALEEEAPAVSIGDDSLYADGPRRRSSKDKIATVKDPGTKIQPRTVSSAKVRSARKASRSDHVAVKPRVIAPNSGKTLRPAPMGPPALPNVPQFPAPGIPVPMEPGAPGSVASSMPPRVRTGPPPLPLGEGALPPPMEPSAMDRLSAKGARPPPLDLVAIARGTRPAASLPKPPALPRTDERTPEPGPAPVAPLRAATSGAAGGAAPARAAIAKLPLTRIQVPRKSVSRPPAAIEKPPASRPSKHPKRVSLKPPPKASKPPERRGKTTPPPRSVAPKSTRARSPASLSEPPDEEAIDTGWDEKD